MSIATIIDQDHRNDVKMFKFQVERRVVTLQSFEHFDHLCLYYIIILSVDKSVNSARVMPSNQRSDFPHLPCLWLKTRYFKLSQTSLTRILWGP